MTKRDMLNFLMPFTDDIEIVFKAPGRLMTDCKLRYEVHQWGYRLPRGKLIEKSDGIIVLEEQS